MKLFSPDDLRQPGRTLIFRVALIAVALGLSTWIFLTLLVPSKPPEDFPKLPDLQLQNAAMRELLGKADAEARAHPNSAQYLGRLGMAYHANQYYDQAGSAYRIAARLESDDYRWVYCQALMEEENGREKVVFDLLQRTVHLQPRYIPALLKLGDYCFKQDQLSEAAGYYSEAVNASDNGFSLQATFGLGRVEARRQDWRKVIGYLAPLSQRYPRIRPPHQLLADAYEALGMADKAAEEQQSLLQPKLFIVPPVEDPLGNEVLELCCRSTRLLKQAGYLGLFETADKVLRVARRAVEIQPDDADAQHFLARALLESQGGDPRTVEEALIHLQEGLRLRPDDPKPVADAAPIFFRQNKTEAAVEQFRTLLANNTRSAEALYFLGVIADRQGKINEAAAHYSDALKLDPDYAEPCHRLGIILVGEGKFAQAIVYLQRAVRLKPKFMRAHFNLGVALERQGKLFEAMAEYREALRLEPNDAAAHMGLGLALVKSGKIEEAVSHYREAVRLAPGDAQAHYGLGYVLAGQRKFEEAAEEFRQALKLQPDFAEARNQLQQLTRKNP